MSLDTALDRLAERVGIFSEYHDLSGTLHVAPEETKRALLDAMGLDPDDAVGELRRIEGEERRRRLPLALVLRAGEPARVDVPGLDVDWRFAPDPRTNLGQLSGRSSGGAIDLPVLPVGLHLVIIGVEQTLIIAAPPTAPDLASKNLAAPRWGVTTALYGLTSDRNFGLGTYDDLAEAAEALAEHGADFLGVNPVHALGAASGNISPYSPTHRGFLNTDHIAPSDGWNDPAARALRDGSHADYAASRLLTLARLRDEFADVMADQEQAGVFAAYRQAGGHALEDFAVFEVLSRIHGADWRRWPEDLQRPTSPTVRAFAVENARDVAFHAFLQWRADTQLGGAQQRARDAGMALGLYVDLAIGVRPDGAEVWAEPKAFARGVSLGTPPDQFNTQGQVWGLAPMSPIGLARDLYRPFVDTVRTVFRHAGLARIDHVLGFMRCFWVPESEAYRGAPGAYVRYPWEILLAITKVEATHAGCLVIGEDLGVLPEGLREKLSEARLYGCSVAQFERDHEGQLRHPKDFRPATLASFGTHDTATLRGFWQGWEINRQQEFGQFDEDAKNRSQSDRYRDRWRLSHMLAGGDSHEEPPGDLDAALINALHEMLGEAGSELIAVQLDDVCGRVEQANFPGTVSEYPNWRLKAPIPVASLRDLTALDGLDRVTRNRRN
jgi:4-alpha-glucanotransferase